LPAPGSTRAIHRKAGRFPEKEKIYQINIKLNPQDEASLPVTTSLVLIKPTDISWYITRSVRGKRQARTLFIIKRVTYDLAMTDPLWEQRLKNLDLGVHPKEAVDIELIIYFYLP
jgi:hypothetical protein